MTVTQPTTDIEKRIPIDSVWVHRTSGGKYQVKDHHEGADGYETGTALERRVSYIQLEDGQIRKAGSRYSRSVTDFLREFDPVSGSGSN